MKLYFAPGACSQAAHICLREAGATFDTIKVDLRAKTCADGTDFKTVNSKGYVPALGLDDGAVLTENVAILLHLAEKFPEAKLGPKAGTLEYLRLIEWLAFTTSELHKGIGAAAFAKEEMRPALLDRLAPRLAWANAALEGKSHPFGDHFTVVDAYMFVVLSWLSYAKFDLAPTYPNLAAFMERTRERPSVKAALAAEFGG
jgi:glutathione S-transferase